MYELLCRSSQRPWAPQPEKLVAVPERGTSSPLILHMQENRSHLTQDARVCFSVIALLFLVTSIAPALKGHWLVPVFSILALAGLTFALERHGKSRPASETLELAEGRVRHRDSAGQQVELPSFWMRLAAEGRSPSELRLFLRGRDGSIEFGRCLSLDERRAVAPLVAAALAQTRGC
ncbi:hypothetical protein C7W88_04400 [Novosphingobium sp. THN1]|jgi:uncharacterized membrane protein|uniref:DUF2244 domain-containing protein n=1 Tax=Sphingomonadales TaxID=204457 RepID=UPI000E51938A|nr:MULTISPECIES: DUF2244 domain-containing protein [Sphingomonadaceae]AXU18442.1 hypothetical protein C7W88_04400 [Novosphingobium sp. THN1]